MFRRRRFLVIAGAGLAAAGLMASGCVSYDPGTRAPVQPSAASFDPLVRPVTLGWLPDGMVHNLTRISFERYELTYVDSGSLEPGALPATEIHLQVWPPDLAYWQLPGAATYDFRETAPIAGQPAQWRSFDQHMGALRWEYRPRSWAELDVRVPAADALDIARRIAQGARFDATERVRLPWRLSGLPSGLAVRSLQVIEDNSYQPWRAELVFVRSTVDSSDQDLLIVRANKGPVSPVPGERPSPNTTVQGYPARLEHGHGNDASGDVLYIYAAHDIVHHVYASSGVLPMLGAPGLVGLAEHFELLEDPPTWTDRPLA